MHKAENCLWIILGNDLWEWRSGDTFIDICVLFHSVVINYFIKKCRKIILFFLFHLVHHLTNIQLSLTFFQKIFESKKWMHLLWLFNFEPIILRSMWVIYWKISQNFHIPRQCKGRMKHVLPCFLQNFYHNH